MKRFVLYSRTSIEKAPLQVYCSALVFTPKHSLIRLQFADAIPRWICRLSEPKDYESTELQTLEGHEAPVNAILFSPDDKILASASIDGIIRLWDAGTGRLVRTLAGHRRRPVLINFSQDSQLLASAPTWKDNYNTVFYPYAMAEDDSILL